MQTLQTKVQFCCTCLKSGIQLNNTLEIDSNDIDYTTKLRFCVPEVEWAAGHICGQCSGHLNQCYDFKEQCLKSNEILTQGKFHFLSNNILENEKPKVKDDTVSTSDGESYSDNFMKVERLSDAGDSDYEEEKCDRVEVTVLTENGQYSCSLCDNSYTDRNLLFLHKKNTHKEEHPYNCLYCNEVFKYNRELKRHEPIHSDHTGFVCDICKQSYNTSSILAKHKVIKHTKPDTWKYVCRHCDKKYPFKSNLDQHISRHHTNAGDTYICYHCNESYNSRILLIAHIRSKHSTKNMLRMKECHVCQKMYINQVVLENHMRKEHNVGATKLIRRLKQYPCEKCGKKYTTTKILNTHARVCDGIKRHFNKLTKMNKENAESERRNKYGKSKDLGVAKQKIVYLTCEFCEKIVGPYKRYVVHCVEEHNSDPETLKPYLCKECKERFSTSTLLSRHRLQHTGKKAHICSFCGKGFKTRKDMLTHEKLHSNKREVQCELCSKRFHTKSYLRSHKLVVHTDPMRWKYVCQYCGKRFPMKSNYDHHVRRHTGEKPFACHLCEKRFSDKFVLQQHFNSHSNIRAFKCEHCGKEYKSARVLGIHLKKAHGIGNYKVPIRPKKFVCDYCSKCFAARDKLRRHLCSHTGERPYACHICEKRFTDKSYVKQHLKSVHNLLEVKQELEIRN